MGIPKFYGQWLKTRGYKGLIQRFIPGNVSSLLIDMNGLIHSSAQEVYAYGEGANSLREKEVAERLAQNGGASVLEYQLVQTLLMRLSNLLTTIQPTIALVLAIDGVAPLAKIQQQRQRRYRAAEEQRSGRFFDSNAITPGTQLMTNLDREIRSWIVKNKYILPPKVIYSGHLTPGEGEHKILDLLRAGEVPGKGAHVLYGLDADLIMLSLIAPVEKIYLMREDIRDVVNIDNLKVGLEADLETPTALNDFILMMFFIGNDFLPHLPSMSEMVISLETMFTVYKAFSLSLTYTDEEEKSQINWPNLTTFLSELAKYEPLLLDRQAEKSLKYPSRFLEASTITRQEIGKSTVKTVNLDQFRNVWYSNALGPHGNQSTIATAEALEEERLSNKLPDFPGEEDLSSSSLATFKRRPESGNLFDKYQITEERSMEMFTNYLNGLAWVYSYYLNSAQQINLDYIYLYSHAPLIIDLAEMAKYIPAPGYTPLEGNLVLNRYQPEENNTFLNPLHQLIAVIPPKSIKVLPGSLRALYQMESPIFDMFPKQFIIEREGVNEDWQGTVIIPPVEADRIKEAVGEIFGIGRLIDEYSAKPNIVEITEEALRKQVENQLKRPKTFGQYSNRIREHPTRGRGFSTRGRGFPTRGQNSPGRGSRGRGFSSQESERGPSTRGSSRGSSRGSTRGFSTRGPSSRGPSSRGPSSREEEKESWKKKAFLI